jgi:hypothetical protein
MKKKIGLVSKQAGKSQSYQVTRTTKTPEGLLS